jgi:hypothetical protein
MISTSALDIHRPTYPREYLIQTSLSFYWGIPPYCYDPAGLRDLRTATMTCTSHSSSMAPIKFSLWRKAVCHQVTKVSEEDTTGIKKSGLQGSILVGSSQTKGVRAKRTMLFVCFAREQSTQGRARRGSENKHCAFPSLAFPRLAKPGPPWRKLLHAPRALRARARPNW